jgi:hypothetical protein
VEKNICEVTFHAIWPLAKSLMKRDRLKAPAAIHGPSGLKFLPLEKANAIANCLEKQFTPQEENHERRVVTRFQTLFEAVDSSPEKLRPCDVLKLINSKIKKDLRNLWYSEGMQN